MTRIDVVGRSGDRRSARAGVLASAGLWLGVIFVLLTIALTWPLARVVGSSVPGDYGDPLFISWVLGWVARKLTAAITDPAALAGFWDAPIFYPEPGALAFSEHFVPQALLILPVYWLTHNLVLCYNAAFLTSYVLTGWGTALLTRALSGSVMAAVLAGVVAAFNEYRLVWEVAHLQTLSIYWFPFVLFGVHGYLAEGRRRALVLAAVSWIALNLTSVYYLAYCTPFIVAFVLVELVRLGKWRERRVWRDLLGAGAAVAAITIPFLLPYAAMQQRLGFARTLQEVVTHSATLDNYRVALPRLIVPVVLAVAAVAIAGGMTVVGRRRRVAVDRRHSPTLVIAMAVFAVAAVWLSLGPLIQAGGHPTGMPALYPLLMPLPGYSGLRVPARFASIFLLFLGVTAGLGVSLIGRRAPRVAAFVAAGAACLFLWQGRDQRVPLDQPLPSRGLAPAPAYLRPGAELPHIYRAVEQLPASAVLAEFPFGDLWYEVRYMFFAATHGRALMNGYSGVFPPSYRARQGTLWRPLRDPARARESLRGATHAIVHLAAWPDATGAGICGWLEGEGARLIGEVGEARLYELGLQPK